MGFLYFIGMTSLTADLEYFKCDLCATYFHKDIFCDHRRLCNGPDSKELNRKQADKIAEALDSEESRARRAKGGAATTLARMEKQRDTRKRTSLSKDLFEAEQAQIRQQLQEVDADALMAELEGA